MFTLRMKKIKANIHRYYRRYLHVKNSTTVVIGDSHVNFFGGSESISWQPICMEYRINMCPNLHKQFDAIHVGGALAYRVNASNSSTQFLKKVEWLEKHFLRRNDTILFCLGEIDVRVHVYKEAERQDKNYREIVDEIVKNYIGFLSRMKGRGYNVWCWGLVASQKDNVYDKEFEYVGNEIERNKATEYFNQTLEEYCKIDGIGFISIFKELITADYQTKTEFYVDSCHLNQKAWHFVANKEL